MYLWVRQFRLDSPALTFRSDWFGLIIDGWLLLCAIHIYSRAETEGQSLAREALVSATAEK